MKLIILTLVLSFHAYSYQQFYDEEVYGQTFEDSFNNMDDNDFGQGMFSVPSEEGAQSDSPQPERENYAQEDDPPTEPLCYRTIEQLEERQIDQTD